jgi:hypothetical protein
MRQRDPKHERRLGELIELSPEDCKKQIKTSDYNLPEYVSSEVLASLVRARFGAKTGVLSTATEELHRRVISGVEVRIRTKSKWQKLKFNNSEVIEDTVSYFWEIFLRDTQEVCNAEVRFYVYLSDRVDDFRKHLNTIENNRKSIDDMTVQNEDGDFKNNFIDTVEDNSTESSDFTATEEAVIRIEDSQKSMKIMEVLSALPQNERNAYYFRVHCEYDWKTVAEFIGCSIPTARKHLNGSLLMLQGML